MIAVDTFNRLLKVLAPHLGRSAIPPPAEAASLRAAQVQLRRTLPPSLIAAYSVCNGGPKVPDNPLAENLFYSYRFLSVEQVLALASGLENTRRSEGSPVPHDPIPSVPPNTVQDLYTSPHWVAFADDRAGGYLAIDYAPGPNGTVGQVINFGRDDTTHFQLATCFDAFLERVLTDYQNEKNHYFFGDTMLFVDRLLSDARTAHPPRVGTG